MRRASSVEADGPVPVLVGVVAVGVVAVAAGLPVAVEGEIVVGVPGVFGAEALLFACAYAAVRAAHIVLFMLASRWDAELRHSVVGLAASTCS